MRQKDELKGWSNKELERLLYFWADPREQRKIVKIAPGENANLWPECLSGGYIRVGWGAAGDLRECESKDAYRAKFSEAYGAMYKNHQPTISKKSNEVWMLRELEPGDLVVANRGTSHVLAVGEVVEPGYEWGEHQKDFNNIVHVKWDTSYEQGIPAQGKWAFMTVAPIPQSLATQILATKNGDTAEVPVDPLNREVAEALIRKGQVILYGPPGTGKTFTALRFSVWWLTKQMGGDTTHLMTNKDAFDHAERALSTGQTKRRAWWIVANPSEWQWNELFKTKRESYRYGRLQRNYPLVQPGDLVIGYEASPAKLVVAVAKVTKGLHTSGDRQQIELEPVALVEQGPTYEQMQQDAILGQSEPMRLNCQGTLFALTGPEYDRLAEKIIEHNPRLEEVLFGTQEVGPLTRLTFHASYSYEDFIEGFRPVDTGSGNLVLRLEDGIFKRVCRAAQANPKKPYLVMIDEINRANVAKVLGELITLLEKDKRGLLISLPQSKEAFTIPPNVYVLGTMNTADRSIKLLDAALRRRFAFLELMPDTTLLQGGKVGNLALDEFLDELNRRIAAKEGREKQIGHSFLMDGSGPVSEPEEFARRFRQEILPLLQEYCYDDYRVLAEYIGEKLVDKEGQRLNEERLADPESLVAALEEEFADKGIPA